MHTIGINNLFPIVRRIMFKNFFAQISVFRMLIGHHRRLNKFGNNLFIIQR